MSFYYVTKGWLRFGTTVLVRRKFVDWVKKSQSLMEANSPCVRVQLSVDPFNHPNILLRQTLWLYKNVTLPPLVRERVISSTAAKGVFHTEVIIFCAFTETAEGTLFCIFLQLEAGRKTLNSLIVKTSQSYSLLEEEIMKLTSWADFKSALK